MYLSNEANIEQAMELTELSLDEIEAIVGRFAPHSWRAGQLRGEVVVRPNGQVIIRHHFSKKILWTKE